MADQTFADTIEELAAEALEHAPPRFALAGLSMGGYVALEIMRQTPERVQGLALLSTSARPHLGKIVGGPTMILCGRQDILTPLELHEEMAAASPDSRLVVIEAHIFQRWDNRNLSRKRCGDGCGGLNIKSN